VIAAALGTTLDDLFDEYDTPLTAGEFRFQTAQAITDGIAQASDAYAYSLHSDGHTYGTNRWRFVLAEMARAFDRVPGTRPLKSGGLRVPVVPVGVDRSILVYPLCFANDAETSPQHVQVRPSRLRRLLFAPAGRQYRGFQQMLPFDRAAEARGVPAFDEVDVVAADEDGAVEAVEADLAARVVLPRTVIAGYASDPLAGLLQLVVGEAVMDPDGTLAFSWLEQMPVRPLTRDAPHAIEVDDVPGFAAAPEPAYELLRRDADDTGERPGA
jgi:hypothetical protein